MNLHGQYILGLFALVLPAVLFSVDAHADGLGGGPLPSVAEFADAGFQRASQRVARGEFRAAERVLRRRMGVVRKRFEAAFHGPRPAARRAALDRWVVNPHPVLVVVHDRFWFHADIYRLAANLALRNGRPEVARDDLRALLDSGQATLADVKLADDCLGDRDDPRLSRAITRWRGTHRDGSR